MAYDIGTARGVIEMDYNGRGVTQAQADLDNLEGKGNKTLGTLGRLGAAFSGAAIVAGLAAAINTTAEFEHQISAIAAVSGATGQELDAMREKALQLGADTAFSATEAAAAMEELVKAGLSVDEVLNGAADAAVALAAAGGIGIPEAATIAANSMNQFNLAAEDMNGVVDSIAGAANASAIDVSQLGQALTQSGAVANLAGLSFEDTATAIALMGNAGIAGSDAGTSLKTMLQNLQPTTTKQKELFEELGLVTEDGANKFFDAEGNVRSYADIAGVLSNALKGQTNQQKLLNLETLFGTDAIRAAAIAADAGRKGVNELNAEMRETTAAEVAAARMDNFKGSMDELMGSIETAIITGGSGLLPMLREVVEWLTQVINKSVTVGGELADRVGPGFSSLAGSIEDIVNVGIDVVDMFDGIVGAVGRLALGTVIASFNTLAGALEAITGAVEGHEDMLVILAGTYLLLANGGVVVLAGKLGWLAAGAMVKALDGFIALDGAARRTSTSITAVSNAALVAAANLAAVAIVVEAVKIWNAYSSAVDDTKEALDRASDTQASATTFTAIAEETEAIREQIEDRKKAIDEVNSTDISDNLLEGFTKSLPGGGALFAESEAEAYEFANSLDDLSASADGLDATLIGMGDSFTQLQVALGAMDPSTAEDLMQALEEGDPDAIAALDQMLTDIQPLLDKAGIGANEFVDALKGTGDLSLGEVEHALATVNSNAGQAASATRSLSDAARSFGDEALSAADKADALKEALDNLIGVELNADQAAIAWRESLRAIADGLKDVEGATFGATRAGDANRGLIIDNTADTLAWVEAEAKAGTSIRNITRGFRERRQELIATGVDAGATRKEMVDLLNQYNFTPESVRTLVQAVGAERAENQIDKLIKKIGLTPEEATTLFEATGADTAKEKIEALRAEIRRLEGKDAPIDTPGGNDAIDTIEELRDEIKRLQGKEAPIGTPGAEAAAAMVRNLREQIALLRDKTVTITYHGIRTGVTNPGGGQNFPAGVGAPSRAVVPEGMLPDSPIGPIEMPTELPNPRVGGSRVRRRRATIVDGELRLDPSGRAFIRGVAEEADDDSDDYADTLERMGRR